MQIFQTTPVPEFEDEVVRGEVITGRLLDDRKMKLRYFRFPYNHTGPNKQAKEALLQFLAERNYISTPFTVEHADYIFDQVYASAQKAGDDNAAHRIGAAYLDQLDIAFTFAEKRARDDFGRDIPQVFLIHSNDINAEYLGVMLDRLQQRGYKFISLDEAMADPAYKTADDYVGAYGISWLHRWRIAMGKDASYRDDRRSAQMDFGRLMRKALLLQSNGCYAFADAQVGNRSLHFTSKCVVIIVDSIH